MGTGLGEGGGGEKYDFLQMIAFSLPFGVKSRFKNTFK